MNSKLSIFLVAFFVYLFIVSCNSDNRADVPLFKGDLFDDTHLHELHLYFKSADFWDSLVLFKKQKDSLELNRYLKCDMNLDGVELKDIGMRLKGESSYDFTKGKKKSFKLDLNCFVRKQKHGEVSRINLNNNYKDPSMLREKLTLNRMVNAGVPAPRSAFVKVYLNETYWGVYLMVEAINKDFLKRNFGNIKGNLYIGEPNGTLAKLDNMDKYIRSYRKKNNKKRNDWADLLKLINVINASGTDIEVEKDLDTLLNIDNCLKAWAINNLLVNVDAYNMMYPHNYFLYNDSSSLKMQWINYDYNYSFAAWNPTFTYKGAVELPVLYHNEKHPLAELVLTKNKALQKRYLQILKNIVETDFSEKQLAKEINTYSSLIKDAVYEDKMKEFTNDEFDKNKTQTIGDVNDPGAYIPGLIPFVRERSNSVKKQISTSN